MSPSSGRRAVLRLPSCLCPGMSLRQEEAGGSALAMLDSLNRTPHITPLGYSPSETPGAATSSEDPPTVQASSKDGRPPGTGLGTQRP